MPYLEPRLATGDDVAILVRHRARMFAEMGVPQDERFAAMCTASSPWFRDAIARGTYAGFLIASADAPQQIVAGAGLLFLEWPPGLYDVATARAYILNVYTEIEHRNRGLARTLTLAAIDEARRRGVRVVTLHASDAGRRLYERLGFVQTNEMRLIVSPSRDV